MQRKRHHRAAWTAAAFTLLASVVLFATSPAGAQAACGDLPIVQVPEGGAAFFATNESECIVGTPDNDLIFALGGDDVILGLQGNDGISGGDGNDRIFGGAGDDQLIDDAGADLLNGGNGDDFLDGQDGTIDDRLRPSNGDDVFRVEVDRSGNDEVERVGDLTNGNDCYDVFNAETRQRLIFLCDNGDRD